MRGQLSRPAVPPPPSQQQGDDRKCGLNSGDTKPGRWVCTPLRGTVPPRGAELQQNSHPRYRTPDRDDGELQLMPSDG